MSIENILNGINENYQKVTSLIETKFNFYDQPDYDYTSLGNDVNFGDFPEVLSSKIQPDGKIIVCGYISYYDPVGDYYYAVIKRFNADGSVDSTFHSPRFDNDVEDIALQSDGKIIVVGSFQQAGIDNINGSFAHILRLNSDGSIDETFNSGTGFNDNCYVCKITNDGKILVGGYFSSYNETNSAYLAKLNSDGSIDSTFAGNIPNFSDGVIAIAEDSIHNFYVGGWFPSLFKILSNGTLDESFNPSGVFNAPISTIKIDLNGKILIGGYFSQYNGQNYSGLVRFNTDGSLDNSFSMIGVGFYNYYVGYYGNVEDIAVQSDNKIIVVGYFSGYNLGTLVDPVFSRKKGIIRLLNDGTIDNSFVTGSGFDDVVNCVLIDSNNNIFCGGSIFNYNGRNLTEEFNCGYSYCAAGFAKLNTSGNLIGTSLKQNIHPCSIKDGGNDIWDDGLFFNTNLTQSYDGPDSIANNNSIPYTHSVLNPGVNANFSTFDLSIGFTYDYVPYNYDFMAKDGEAKASDSYFGTGSSYFTNMYPGLFVLGANNIQIDQFSITGNIGVDGSGNFSSGSFDTVVNGVPYAVFYKSVYNGGDPSIVEMIIVSGVTNGINHNTYSELYNDDQVLTGLSGRKELYVLAFSRYDSQDTSLDNLTSIANAFLSVFAGNLELITSCSNHACQTTSFKCYVGTTQSCTCSKWKYFYTNCTRLQQNLGICTNSSGAYLPAIVVCNQRLF
jgi:uncharacterized delta-60 repeat protein